MSGIEFIHVFLNSIVVGVVYILIASGLALVFSIMRIVNFAHGQFYMLGAFGVYYLYQELGMNYIAALIITTLAVAILGLLIERFFFRPFKAPHLHNLGMIVSIGLILLIEGIGFSVFKPVERFVAPPLPGHLNIMAVRLPIQNAMAIIVGMILISGLFVFTKWGKWGQAMRAVADDEVAAALQGININFTRMLAFSIGCALAAIAGGVMAGGIVVHPGIGAAAILKAFIVVVLGGLGSIAGTVLGGLLLGFIESFGIFFLGYWINFIVFCLLILILLVRPKGLLGHD